MASKGKKRTIAQAATTSEEPIVEHKLNKDEKEKTTSIVINVPAENKIKKSKKGESSIKKGGALSDTIYIGHIPHGFYEKELKSFFSQFGGIRRVKLFRSEKTKGSKGYAFVQFASIEVPPVVAEAIHGYFLHDRQLVCHVVPASKCHEGMFLPPKQKPEAISNSNNDVISTDKPKKEITKDKVRKITRLQNKKRARLQELGIEFNF